MVKIVKNKSDLKGLKRNDLIQYKCRSCGKKVIRRYRTDMLYSIVRFVCSMCGYKMTSMDKYGVDNPTKSKEIQAKIEATNMTKYGVKSTLSLPNIQEKIKETNIALYGVDNVFKSPEFQKKIEQTNLRKYGVKTTLLLPDVQEKIKQTMLDIYGVEHPMQSPEIQEKVAQTMMDRHGAKCSTQSKEIMEKIKHSKFIRYGREYYTNSEKAKETKKRLYGYEYYNNIEQVRATNNVKYGVDYPLQNKEIRDKAIETVKAKYGVDCIFRRPDIIERSQKVRGRKYTYNGEKFDSSWELALWIYAKDHGEDIERVYDPFEYILNGKIHRYFPDFKYKGELVEVKGEQFINDEGVMINVFNSSQDELFAAKQQCAIDHGVKFMYREDVQFAIDYVRHKFGNEYRWYLRFATSSNSMSQLTPPPLMMMPMYIYPTIPMMLPWWMFMIPCDFNPYSMNVFEREGMEFVDCE